MTLKKHTALTTGVAAAAAVLTLLLAGCGAPAPQTTTAAAAPAAEPAWVADARGVATAVPPKLLAVLKPAIERDGPAEAISLCKDEAPKLAAAASAQSGWQVRRVSLRNRNPKAVPDAWERATLEGFDRSLAAAAAGGPPPVLERAEQVIDNGQPVRRYMRALPTQALCLQCHGPADKLGPGVAARLAALYPDDRATGYAEGQIRGAMTLRQPVR